MAKDSNSDSWKGSSDYSRPNSSTDGTKGQAPAANVAFDWHGEVEMTRPTSSPSSDKVTLVSDSKPNKGGDSNE